MSARQRSPVESSPRKRSKISNACDACQRRKSRCELLTDAGCHRCRILRTRCSLAGLEAPLQASAEPTPAPVNGDLSRLEYLPEAVDRLTETIDKLAQRMLPSGSQRSSTGSGQAWPLLENDMAAAPAAPTHGTPLSVSAAAAGGINLQSRSRIVDPLGVGLVSKAVLVEAARVTQSALLHVLCPMLTEDLVDAVHRCSFLASCVLSYAARIQPTLFTATQIRQLAVLNHSNFAHMPYAPPTTDMVVGLLMTSVSPSEGDERDLTIADPKDASVRAMALAKRLGLDDLAWSWNEDDHLELARDYKRPKLLKLILWYSVLHRHQWVEIFSSLWCTPSAVRYPFTQLYSHARALSTLNDSIIHLAFEASLLSIVESLAAPLQACRLARSCDGDKAEDLLQEYLAAQSSFDAWRLELSQTRISTALFQRISSYHLQVALCLKLGTEAVGLAPTPLVLPNRLPIMMDFGSRMLNIAADFAVSLAETPFDLKLLPALNLTLSFVSYACLNQSAKLIPEDAPEQEIRGHPAIRYQVELANLRQKLEDSHPVAPRVFHMLDNGCPDPSWRELRNERRTPHGLESYGMGDFTWPMYSNLDFMALFDTAAGSGWST